MFFSPDGDDDDDEFGVTKSSHLSNIFGNLEGSEDKQNTSLRYVAPKQPRRNVAGGKKQGENAAGRLTVIHSSPVNAFKLEEGKYNHQGKLGLAILGNYESHNFVLLMYKDKQHTVARASINLNFVYTVQENNYANFYDDLRMNWSVNFENSQISQNFAVQIGLAKASSVGPILESALIQDASVGSGPEVLSGEIIHIKYISWILADHKLGQVFCSNYGDSDKYRSLTVGDSSFINGFDAGILNLKRGGQRIFILQSHHDVGAKSVEFKVPDKTTLILKVEVKLEEKAVLSSPPSPSHEKPSVPSKPSLNNPADDATVKGRCASLSEQLQSSPKTDKAKLISRMARMGQPMLPVQGSATPAKMSSESDTEEERQLTAELHPVPIPRSKVKQTSHYEDPFQEPRPSSNPSHGSTTFSNPANIISTQPLAVCPPQQLLPALPSNQPLLPYAQANTPYVIMPGQTYMSNTSPLEAQIPVLLSEVRTQNTEIRMQMSQVSDKVDRVLGKVGQTVVYPNMEVGVLAENINRVFQQNETLKQAVTEKDTKIQVLSEKIHDLLQSNQRVLEKNNTMLEQRSDHLQFTSAENQARITQLEREKAKIMQDLSVAQNTVADLENKICYFEKLETELRQEVLKAAEDNSVRQHEENLEQLKKEVDMLQSSLVTANSKLKDEEMTCRNVSEQLSQALKDCDNLKNVRREETAKSTNEITQLTIEIENLKAKLKVVEQNQDQASKPESDLTSESLVEEIKRVMNAVYRSLQKEFVLDQVYTGKVIKTTLANAIRQITLEVIEKYSEVNSADSKASSVESAKENVIAGGESNSNTSTTNKEKESHNVHINESESHNVHINESESHISESVEDTKRIGLNTINDVALMEPNISTQVSNASEVDDSLNEPWRPQPPPFLDDPDSEGEDDWLK